jgi:hypothetical protein
VNWVEHFSAVEIGGDTQKEKPSGQCHEGFGKDMLSFEDLGSENFFHFSANFSW